MGLDQLPRPQIPWRTYPYRQRNINMPIRKAKNNRSRLITALDIEYHEHIHD
jgi:hypothetical protein